MKTWTDEQIDVLKSRYSDVVRASDLCDELEKTVQSIYLMARKLGLKRKFNFGKYREPSPKSIKYQFKKGHLPWNKGMKGICIGGKETQFKKGHTPKNTLFDGAISVRKDKRGIPYKFIRISKGNWVVYQRYLWEKEVGLIPPGGVIRFKNGNTLDVRIDNLILITKKENLIANQDLNSDEYVVSTISRQDKKLREIIKENYPEVIEVKRQQLKLKKEIRDVAG